MTLPRVPRTRAAVGALLIVLLAISIGPSGAAAPPSGHGGGGGGGGKDKVTPTVTIAAVAQSSSTVTVSGSASDNLGVAGVTVAVDGGAAQPAQGTTSWSYSFPTAGLAAGTHTVTVRATDSAGNVGTAQATFTYAAPTSSDTTPPSEAITAPGAGATVSGTVGVTGTASDNTQVAAVAVAVDGGAFNAVSGTTSWSWKLDTATLANGAHTLTARATDGAGNSSTTSVNVSVLNDTAAPTVAFSAPSAGATVSGTVAVSGSASDNVAVAKVELSLDGGAYQPASGTTSWSYSLSTSGLTNASHTLTVRATDSSGNSATASETIAVSNQSSTGAQTLVTPEGVTINVASTVTNWTPQQIYDLLKPNAYELSLVGPDLTINVQTQVVTQTTTSVSWTGDPAVYSGYRATIWLNAGGSAFSAAPDATIAHEYGAAWTEYHLYLTQGDDWDPYLTERGLFGNPLLDSNTNWSRNELIADDYRMLFGTQAAQSEMAYINNQIPDPRTVWGLKNWFTTVWA